MEDSLHVEANSLLNIEISESESHTIQFVRMIALLLIISCHLLQALDNYYCTILNVGVQVFLAMSGYLYGHKFVSNFKKWLLNKIIKLYIPYCIVVVVTFVALYSLNIPTSWKLIPIYLLDLQGFIGGGYGFGHLWFMTAIGVCYLLTPILQYGIKWSGYVFSLLLLIGFIEYGILRYELFKFSWVYLYIISYYFARLNDKVKLYFVLGLFLGLLASISYITIEEIRNYNYWENRLFHDLLGIFLLFAPVFISRYCNFSIKLKGFFHWLEHESYSIYLTHYLFILGPLALINITSHIFFNCFMAVCASLLSAIFVSSASKKIELLLIK